ncbi:hypothetical protein JCM16814_00920 [Desulfobaculum senezii]
MAAAPRDIFTAMELRPGKAEDVQRLWPQGLRATVPFTASLMRTGLHPDGERDVLVWGRFPHGDAPLVWMQDGEVVCGFKFERWERVIREERYRPEHTCPLAARLPFHYHLVPGPLRSALAGVILSVRGRAAGSAHPVTPFNPGCALLLRVVRGAPDAPSVVVLTHDCDTAQGVAAAPELAAVEEEHGWHSIWNVVPGEYDVDHIMLERLRAAGHEIGQHGLTHSMGEAFLPREALRDALLEHKAFRQRHGVRGYRGPGWYRTRAMFDVLGEFFDYDMTCLDNDFICPGGSGGVGEVRPYALRGGLMELPCTVPFEAPLVHGGVRPGALAAWWWPKVEALGRLGGHVVVNTHPDPHYSGRPEVRAAYAELLSRLSSAGWSARLPGELFSREQDA